MPKCVNDPGKRYSGNENTPRGKGYSASAEKVGKRMKGLDGSMYVVEKKGSSKKWVKIKTKKSMLSPMSKRKSRRKKAKKKRTYYKEESEDSEQEYCESEYSENDEDDLEWKMEAAEDRCKLSDVFCTRTLIANVGLLAWTYFKDWYRRVQYGEDPYKAYEDVKTIS